MIFAGTKTGNNKKNRVKQINKWLLCLAVPAVYSKGTGAGSGTGGGKAKCFPPSLAG